MNSVCVIDCYHKKFACRPTSLLSLRISDQHGAIWPGVAVPDCARPESAESGTTTVAGRDTPLLLT